MKLSRYFTLEELTVSETAKRLGIDNTPKAQHLVNLKRTAEKADRARDILARPITPTSGYRGPQLNQAVGGVPTSDHSLGHALDFMGNVVEIEKLARELPEFDQLILERNGTVIHLSFNPRNRRQCLRQPGGPGSKVYQGFRP